MFYLQPYHTQSAKLKYVYLELTIKVYNIHSILKYQTYEIKTRNFNAIYSFYILLRCMSGNRVSSHFSLFDVPINIVDLYQIHIFILNLLCSI